MSDKHETEQMTLSRHGRRELAWLLRQERGWTLARIGRRLGVKTPAVSRLLGRAANTEMSVANVLPLPRRIAVRRIRAMSLSSVFHA
jgi:hypothetical protein